MLASGAALPAMFMLTFIHWRVELQLSSHALQDSDNPDLRDRGYIYWRLLSTDPEAAKQASSRVYSDEEMQHEMT